MKEQYKDYPICVNCKYYKEEQDGPLRISKTCGLTMIDPVTGEYQQSRSRIKLAAAYRKTGMPCGVAGNFFKTADKKKKVKPEEGPVVVEEPKESTAKVVKVDAPEIKDEPKEENLLPLEPGQRRRRRAKS